MARRLWLITASAFAALALLAWPLDRDELLWHPDQPWRAFSAPFAHLSLQHLIANLAGCAAVGLLGSVARLPARSSVAWLIAWPLTQWGLLLRPDLVSYGGLSSVLHAGVAVIAMELLTRPGRERKVALALFAGLLLKLWLEDPFGPATQARSGWDIAIAPFAHLSGAISGCVSAYVLRKLARPLVSARTPPAPDRPDA
ncbi:MAG: rhombosortase [Paucibacter sp.]|nr:rhombosortase [Roseateles sp.]